MATIEEKEVPNYLKFSKIIVWAMYFWVMLGVAALTMRVFLLAFSANLDAGFVRFIHRLSGDYLEPFRGIFPTRSVGETGFLDISAIFAIIVLLFVAWGFSALTSYIQSKIDELSINNLAQTQRPQVNKKVSTKITTRDTL